MFHGGLDTMMPPLILPTLLEQHFLSTLREHLSRSLGHIDSMTDHSRTFYWVLVLLLVADFYTR
jgi:hypothetical protein